MALIGEMQYLTIGGNTYSLPVGGGGTVTSVAVSNATNGGLSVSGSPISSSGTITIGHSNVLAAAQTTQAVYPIKIDKNGHISGYGTAVTIPDISGKVNIEETNGETTTNVIRENGGVELQAWGDGASTALGIYPGVISLDTEIDSGGYPGIYLSKTNREIVFQRGTIKYTPTGSNYSYAITGTPTAARTLTLPNATGTVALTSDIPTVPTKTSDLTNDSGYITDVQVDGTSVVTGGVAEINSEIFVVNLISTEGTYTSDKTVSEIIAAYNNGKTVIAKDTSFNTVYFVGDIDVQNSTVYFGHVTFNDSYNLRDPVYLENNYFYIDSNGVDSGYYSFQVAYDLHTHGNITNTGDITTTATIASGDRLVINDESASKVNNSSITFGTSTSQYLANNGTWQNVPSVPTKTSDLTNDSGFITSYTDEKLKVAEVTSGTTYYPLVGTGTTAATRQYDTTGLTYQANNGIANDPSSNGVSILTLGNNKASSSSGWKRGRLKFQNVSYYTELGASKPSANRTVLLPDKTGTIALTSDIPTTHSVPSGGTTGQALVKNSATDYDVSWVDVTTTAAQIIRWTESA